MSEDDFRTRKVEASEMDRLRELLDKVERVPEIRITMTPDLYARISAVEALCDLDAGSEDARILQAAEQIFETGLRDYEIRAED